MTPDIPREMTSQLINTTTGNSTLFYVSSPNYMILYIGIQLSLLRGRTVESLTCSVPADRPPPSPQSLAGHGSRILAYPPE